MQEGWRLGQTVAGFRLQRLLGRGASGEIFKIETDLPLLLRAIRQLMSDTPLGIMLSCHTPELTPIALAHVLGQEMEGVRGGRLEHGEMLLRGPSDPVLPVPSGSFARWMAV
jgi:23S rRNA (cytosine1962-C5)-methyltransferase